MQRSGGIHEEAEFYLKKLDKKDEVKDHMLACFTESDYDLFKDPTRVRKLVDKMADILEPPEAKRELLEPKREPEYRKHRNAYPFLPPVNKKGRTHYPSDRAMLLCTANPIAFY